MKRLQAIVYTALVLASLTGCATVGSTPGSTRTSAAVAKTVDMFGSATAGEIVTNCAVPLLFNQELLVRETDIRRLVSSIQSASDRFDPIAVDEVDGMPSISPVFGDRFETRAFAENYVPSDARIVTVLTDIGEVRLLLGVKEGDVRRILGVALP